MRSSCSRFEKKNSPSGFLCFDMWFVDKYFLTHITDMENKNLVCSCFLSFWKNTIIMLWKVRVFKWFSLFWYIVYW